VPDFLLSVGVTYPEDLRAKEHRSYFVWVFAKGPDVVGEIVSDRRGGEDTLKLRQYAALSIRYYFIYDPDDLLRGGVLRLYGLHPEGYRLIPDNTLNGLGLSLTLWSGSVGGAESQWLRWCDKDGKLIPTGREQATCEKRRADKEKRRAETEKRRANELDKRLKRLEAQMRAAGIEPPP
jgi:Putative restriction endonuclease